MKGIIVVPLFLILFSLFAQLVVATDSLFFPPELSRHSPCGNLGDVTGDGQITIADIDTIRSFILGNRTLSESQKKSADVTGEGDVTGFDTTFIARFLGGLESTFPACSPTTSFTKVPFVPKSPPIISSPSITTCGMITAGGDYTISKDLVSNNGECLQVKNVNDVHLTCSGKGVSIINAPTVVDGGYLYSSSVILFDSVRNFSLKNCVVKTISPSDPLLTITHSSFGEITGNTFVSSSVKAIQNTDLTIDNNVFDSSFYEQTLTNRTDLIHNTFTFDPSRSNDLQLSSNIAFFNGADNNIKANTVDGAAPGLVPLYLNKQPGADDAILLSDEKGATVQNNVLKNVWDCAIETENTIDHATILNNSIQNARFCGIGAWYGSNWKNNFVADNLVEDSLNLFIFGRFFGLRPGESGIYFTDNRFEDNKLVRTLRTIDINPSDASSYFNIFLPSKVGPIPGERIPSPNEMFISNNRFTGNDFSTVQPAPIFGQASLAVDGGGNICGDTSGRIVPYPLVCNTPTVCGDINGDGKITTLDITLIRRHILGLAPLSKEQQVRADVNRDGKVSTLDVVLIRRHILGTDTTPLQCAASL